MKPQISLDKIHSLYSLVREVSLWIPFRGKVRFLSHTLIADNEQIAKEFVSAVQKKFETDSIELFGQICPEVEEQEALKQLQKFANRQDTKKYRTVLIPDNGEEYPSDTELSLDAAKYEMLKKSRACEGLDFYNTKLSDDYMFLSFRKDKIEIREVENVV